MRKTIHSAHNGAVAARLRALREKAGMTQRDLAAALEVPHSSVGRIEQGERRVDLFEFYQIVIVLGGSPKKEMASAAAEFQKLDAK